MKFLHLSDLHFGKRLFEQSLMPDQQALVDGILAAVDREQPDAVLIAGDVYDKGVPSIEAVRLLDRFLSELSLRKLPAAVIGGNHDGAERLDFLKSVLAPHGLAIAGVPQTPPDTLTFSDEFGEVQIVLLPFIKPALIRPLFPDRTIDTYEQAVGAVLSTLPPWDGRRVLVAHQFVTAAGLPPEKAGSESVSVGGVDNVDAGLFDGFDYVALGHIHRPQAVGKESVRYAGSPLKYSFAEAGSDKNLLFVTLREKGDVTVCEVPVTPLHDLRELRGPLEKLTDPAVIGAADRNDYLSVTLTDEEPLTDPIGALRAIYPNVLTVRFDNRYTAAAGAEALSEGELETTPDIPSLFAHFFEEQTGAAPDTDAVRLIEDATKTGEET